MSEPGNSSRELQQRAGSLAPSCETPGKLGLAHSGRSFLLLWALLTSLLGTGCGERAARPNIVLLVVDTLRADHLGSYGYPRPTSPVLDALAAKGTLFVDVTASSSWTRPSIGSLFTSRLPSEHRAVSVRESLDPDLPTLAERLRDSGYRTLGISGNFPHVHHKSGLARGFETFVSLSLLADEPKHDTLMRIPLWPDAPGTPFRAPTAEEVNERVFAELPEPGDRPLFLYVHYMDPHSGYLAPERFRALFESSSAPIPSPPEASSDYVVDLAAGRAEAQEGERERLVDLYDAEIRYVDSEIGRLLAELDARGYGQDTVVVVLSDHGEEFADHGGWFHGITLHGELLRVPLIFRDWRGELETGLRRDPVELLDVPVTLLALANVEPAPGMRGRALFGTPERSGGSRVAELHPGVREERTGPLQHRVAVARGGWKVLVDREGTASLYQLERDPDEQSPLPADHPSAPASLVREARAAASALAGSRATDPSTLSPEEREALRALGYAE
jgi:arylsulfatase